MTSETKETEKVARIGVKREKGYIYFLDKEGDISRAKMRQYYKRKKEDG